MILLKVFAAAFADVVVQQRDDHAIYGAGAGRHRADAGRPDGATTGTAAT